jgi:hypothetical protein
MKIYAAVFHNKHNCLLLGNKKQFTFQKMLDLHIKHCYSDNVCCCRHGYASVAWNLNISDCGILLHFCKWGTLIRQSTWLETSNLAMVWQCSSGTTTMTSWPTYWVLLFHCFYIIHNLENLCSSLDKGMLTLCATEQFCVRNVNGWALITMTTLFSSKHQV